MQLGICYTRTQCVITLAKAHGETESISPMSLTTVKAITQELMVSQMRDGQNPQRVVGDPKGPAQTLRICPPSLGARRFQPHEQNCGVGAEAAVSADLPCWHSPRAGALGTSRTSLTRNPYVQALDSVLPAY